MTIEKEVRLWRAFGLGALTSAILLMSAVFNEYLQQGVFNEHVLQLMGLAAIAELLGITMLSISRSMQRLGSTGSSNTTLGLILVALGIAGFAWAVHQSMSHFTPATPVFVLFATMVMSGGLAMLGTERLVRRFAEHPATPQS